MWEVTTTYTFLYRLCVCFEMFYSDSYAPWMVSFTLWGQQDCLPEAPPELKRRERQPCDWRPGRARAQDLLATQRQSEEEPQRPCGSLLSQPQAHACSPRIGEKASEPSAPRKIYSGDSPPTCASCIPLLWCLTTKPSYTLVGIPSGVGLAMCWWIKCFASIWALKLRMKFSAFKNRSQ